MALKLGSLYVSLGADVSNLVQGVGDALKAVEGFTREVKKATNDMAQFTAAVTGIGAAALHLASSVDGPTKQAMDGLTRSTQLLAVEVADTLLPAVRALSADIEAAAQWFAGLDPEIKEAISSFAVMAAQVGAASLVLSRVAGIASTMAGVFKGIASAIGSIGIGPLLNVAIAVAGIIATVVVLHRAWRLNWGGIQEKTAEVVNFLSEAFGGVFEFIKARLLDVIEGFRGFVNMVLNAVDALQKLTGTNLIDTEGLRAGFDGLFDDLKSGEFFKSAVKFGKDVGGQLVDGFKEEISVISKELKDALGLDSLSAGGQLIGLGRDMAAKAAPAAKEAALSRPPLVHGDPIKKQDRGPDSVKRPEGISELDRLGTGVKIVGQKLLGSLGDLGSAVNGVVSGAQAGGVWGAAAAAVMELLTRTQAFSDTLAVANGFMKTVVSAFEPAAEQLTEAINVVLAAILPIIEAFMGSIAPTLGVLSEILLKISPLFELVSASFLVLTPIMALIADVLQAAFVVLKPVIQGLFYIVTGVLIVIGGIIRGVLEVWNGLVEAVATLVYGALMVITLGMGGELAQQAADAIRTAKADTSQVDGMLTTLTTQMNWDAIEAANARRVADLRAADAADKVATSFGDMLTNVPAGFKIARSRYDAQMPADGSAFVNGSGSPIFIDKMQVMANDPAELAAKMKDISETRNFRQSGNPLVGSVASMLGVS